ncbi:MAG TPA: sigma-70 family RNA polymerase sigma factor, partial [Clostridia bacterium]|nr:sigma-70 family RNA polymerase sigma factor [Clostridia bacterium]
MKIIELLKRLLRATSLEEKITAYICGTEALPKPLSAEDEARLIALAAAADADARDSLIEHNLRLVVYLAKRFENTGLELEDLVSVGTIGLIKAVGSFEPAKKIKLATYASRCIENEILMYLRKVVRRKLEVSLDEPLNIDGEGNELLLGDILGTNGDVVYSEIENSVEKQLLLESISHLSKREQQIIFMRFGING